MELDLRQLAESLIAQLWAESDKQRERAEGVRIFLRAIVTESERINNQKEEDGKESNVPAGSPQGQE